MIELNKIYQGDCLEVMKDIPDKSIDAIITDPPYGTTACKWDSVIPFEPMWKQLNRVIKDNGAICLFGSEPFSSYLRMSNIKNYKYDWIWIKSHPTGMYSAKYIPMKYHEIISVFNKHNYYPIMTVGKMHHNKKGFHGKSEHYNNKPTFYKTHNDNKKYPKSYLYFNSVNRVNNYHSTQKPVDLIEYLIKTYTLENETVLDFTIGSGTTAVACINTNRNFIGIEKEQKYVDISNERINNIEKKLF